MITSYKTITSVTIGLYKEKGSKFIAIAQPVQNKDAVDQVLTEIRKKYHDARHHCYAYVLGVEADVYRANDDGEPNHSAGDSILGQIKSYQLTNTLVVVVRYFGGTKLGVSGLINAYKTATKKALANSTIANRIITREIRFLFPYGSMNDTMKTISDQEIKITHQSFDNNCQINGHIPVQNIESLIKKVELLNNLGIKLELILL